MILYVVRHAESVFNSEGRIQGQSDPPLSEHGRRQAESLAGAFDGVAVDAVFASPLRRAYQTAEPLAASFGLEIETDDRLMELNCGVFQGKVWSEIEAEFPQAATHWQSHDPDFQIPGGESRRQLMARGHAAFEAIRSTSARRGHSRVVVVAHGGLLTATIKSLLGVPAERNPFGLFNASVSQLSWRNGHPDSCRLVTLNDIQHLQSDGCATRGGDL